MARCGAQCFSAASSGVPPGGDHFAALLRTSRRIYYQEGSFFRNCDIAAAPRRSSAALLCAAPLVWRCRRIRKTYFPAGSLVRKIGISSDVNSREAHRPYPHGKGRICKRHPELLRMPPHKYTSHLKTLALSPWSYRRRRWSAVPAELAAYQSEER